MLGTGTCTSPLTPRRLGQAAMTGALAGISSGNSAARFSLTAASFVLGVPARSFGALGCLIEPVCEIEQFLLALPR
jgi:hypothetical protein